MRGYNINSVDKVSRPSQIRRQRPNKIVVTASEDGQQHPSSSSFPKFDTLPQLPKLIPPSPLSTSFNRTLVLSGFISSPELSVPLQAKHEVTLASEQVSYRPSSVATVRSETESDESFVSSRRRPGSIFTLAFGKFGSRKRIENEIQEIPVDSEPESSST